MKLATVYGSPTPPGKMARALGLIETGVRDRHPAWSAERIGPREPIGPMAAAWGDNAVEAIAGADAVVLASPVYRGSITGTLKLLIDLLPAEALRSKPVGILTVAAAPQHFLSAERHLRDILGWFGALTAPNSAFFVDAAFRDDEVDAGVLADLGEFADQVVTLAETLNGRRFGPDPLALRHAKKAAG
ncbi:MULTISPECIES: NADPH-dependent FMN reductase [unclassified Streptomyces]|uniref:NADPH-dependent FMN reductase n=1 Tax=unclassified Streptomyces TaxID=2593676 RepID=UPI002E2CF348|nr:NADPH-dependent FMN reductase [Streptomyces sp. NBC_00223]